MRAYQGWCGFRTTTARQENYRGRGRGGLRSRIRTGLYRNSLLSGNLTGKSAKLGTSGRVQAEKDPAFQAFVRGFPKKA